MRFISLFFFLSFFFFACKKQETIENPSNEVHLKKGILVLNEGLYSLNNSTLSWVSDDQSLVEDDFFFQKTGRLLGDTGNDLLRYGSKIYVVMNVSSTIEVLDATTGNHLQQLSMVTSTHAKQPRKIVGYGANVFVSCFDGYVDVIDTSGFKVIKRIKVGENPDALHCVGDKLYVSNSGGLNFPNYDSTLSVIHPNLLIETHKIVVGENPGKIVSREDGKSIYVIVRGDYGKRPSRLKGINVSTDEIFFESTFEVQDIEQLNNDILLYQSNRKSIQRFNTTFNQLDNKVLISNLPVQTFYGMKYLKNRKEICVFDANSYTNRGFLHFYTLEGVYKKKYNVGLNPCNLIEFE